MIVTTIVMEVWLILLTATAAISDSETEDVVPATLSLQHPQLDLHLPGSTTPGPVGASNDCRGYPEETQNHSVLRSSALI